VGLFYFMPIEKRYFNDVEGTSFLTYFKTNDNLIRIHLENFTDIQFVDLTADELKEFICDLNFILKDLND